MTEHPIHRDILEGLHDGVGKTCVLQQCTIERAVVNRLDMLDELLGGVLHQRVDQIHTQPDEKFAHLVDRFLCSTRLGVLDHAAKTAAGVRDRLVGRAVFGEFGD